MVELALCYTYTQIWYAVGIRTKLILYSLSLFLLFRVTEASADPSLYWHQSLLWNKLVNYFEINPNFVELKLTPRRWTSFIWSSSSPKSLDAIWSPLCWPEQASKPSETTGVESESETRRRRQNESPGLSIKLHRVVSNEFRMSIKLYGAVSIATPLSKINAEVRVKIALVTEF